MPALNFQKRFAPAVVSGEKRQTIRARRKVPIKVGDTLYLYTGMRTKNCQKLGEAECAGVHPVFFGMHYCFIPAFTTIEKLATDDGFETVKDLLEWFESAHRLPFRGDLILW